MKKFLVILLEKNNTEGSYTYLKILASGKQKIKSMFSLDYHIIEIDKI